MPRKDVETRLAEQLSGLFSGNRGAAKQARINQPQPAKVRATKISAGKAWSSIKDLQISAGQATKVAFETGNAIVNRARSADRHDYYRDPCFVHGDIQICNANKYIGTLIGKASINGYSD